MMTDIKIGDIVYLLSTGWGVNDKPGWAMWQVRIESGVGNYFDVTMIKKVGAYFFVFKKSGIRHVSREDLFKTTAEAKIELVRRLIEDQIS